MLDDINGDELAASLQRERPARRALFVVADAGEADPPRAARAGGLAAAPPLPAESLLAKVARALSVVDVAAGRRPGA